MHTSTYLLLAAGEQRERERVAASQSSALRLARLRRLDRKAAVAAARARRIRLALG